MGTPTNVKVGPGLLYVAPLDTVAPVDLTTAWAAAWIEMGYTEEGHAFAAENTFEGIEVAEELLPIRQEQTAANLTVTVALAEMTARNVQIALNGGTLTTSGAGPTQIITFEPPELGEATRIALGWESQDHLERWVWYKCLQTGNVEIARRKAPAKATIPTVFTVEIPLAGGAPFTAIFADPA